MPESPNNSKNSRIIQHIINKVESTIRRFNMFQAGDSVLVGVSGGPDSVALLHILCALTSTFPIQLGIAHLNHGLRQEDSEADEAYVKSISRHLGIPLFAEKVDVQGYRKLEKLSLETAARKIRYDFYNRVADDGGFTKIATAHHRDDNAELILMDIFRGCGPKGLSGIPPVRDGKIIRPLIDVDRKEIETFLIEKGISYRSDASNWDVAHLRNKIRHQLMPALQSSYNPQIIGTLNRLAWIVRDDEVWIDDIINSIYDQMLIKRKENHQVVLLATQLREQHVAVKRRIIRKAILNAKGDLQRISLSHVESIIHMLENPLAPSSIDLPNRLRVTHHDKQLVFAKEKEPLRRLSRDTHVTKKQAFTYQLSGPGTIIVPEINSHLAFSIISIQQCPKTFPTGQDVAFFDMDKLSFPLKIRAVQTGDRFSPLGMTGSQKISAFFKNQKVPKSERGKCLLVLDKDDRIIWVVNHRIDDAFKITSSTRRLLKGALFSPDIGHIFR